MKSSVRWIDVAHKLTRKMTFRNATPEEFLLICTGGPGHLVLLAAQLERFRSALGGADVPLVVLASHDSGAVEFLFDNRAEVTTVDVERLGEDRGYRANKMSEMYQSNYKGMVSLDYHRHPHLDEALVKSAQRPAMAMKPASLAGLDGELAENAALYQRQIDSGPAGTPIAERWVTFGYDLSGEDPDLPAATPYRLDAALLPEPATFDQPTVLLQPFSLDPSRQAPVEVFQAALDAVPDDHQVLLLGNDDLLDRTPGYRALLERSNVSLEDTDLAKALPMMLAARLVIASESAPMHVAAVAGAPTLGFAQDTGNGDILPYPETNGPANTRILIGDEVNAAAAASAVKDILKK